MQKRTALLLLLLAVALTYANSFGNGFHFDDFHTVVDNPAIRSLRNTPQFFTDASTFSVLPANRTYRPLVSLSLALDYALGRGYVPWAFHLVTFLCFLLLIVLLSFLFESCLNAVRAGPENQWLALLGAAWFGLHPAMAETVNYVIQRGDLYCTLGCVAALVMYARWPASRRYGAYLLPFVLAMLSKPPAAIFPGLLFFYVLFFETVELPVKKVRNSAPSPSAFRQAIVAVLPALLVDVLLLLLQSRMTPKSFTPSILSAAAYRLTEPYVWLRYIGEMFVPVHLNVDTDLQPLAASDPRVWLGVVLLVALAGGIWFTARRRMLYPIAFGLIWFVLTQLPTSLYPLSEVENDHRMFFSFPGLMLAAVWAGYLLLQRLSTRQLPTFTTPVKWRKLATAFVLCALCGYAFGAHKRNAVWHDEESLWRDDVEKAPRNGRGLMIYGLSQMGKGEYSAARSLFERALLFTPNYPTLEINLGVVNGAMADRGDFARVQEAEEHFERALALAPQDDTAHTFYARWLLEHGLDAEAVPQLEQAIALNPARAMPQELLLGAYERMGRQADAMRIAQNLLRSEPDNQAALAALRQSSASNVALSQTNSASAAFWINASLALYQAKQWNAALRAAQRALTLNPHSAEAANDVAAAYGGLGEWDAAIRYAQAALASDPRLQIARNNLLWFEQQSAQQKGATQPAAKSAEEFVELSLRLHGEGRFQEGLEAARRATVLNPKLPEAWNNLAANAEGLHQWDEAISAARTAVRLKPDFQLAQNNLQWSLKQREQLQAQHRPGVQ